MKLKQDLVEALEDNESCRVVQRKEEALRLASSLQETRCTPHFLSPNKPNRCLL